MAAGSGEQLGVDPPDPILNTQDLFRVIAEHSAIGMCVLGPGGRFRWVNPAMCRLIGRDEPELLAMTWSDITHPADLASNEDLVRQLSDGQRSSFRTEKRYLRSDGTVLWGDVSVAVLSDHTGEPQLFVAQILNITDTVRARDELQASQERYRLLAENASDVVSRSNAEGIVQWVSPSVTEIFGWTPQQMIGMHAFDLIHPDDLPSAETKVRAMNAGKAITNRVRLRCADGSYRWIGATGKPTTDETGKITGRVVGWRDATAEVAAEEALAASEEHYRLLAENASDVIIKTNGACAIAWVSPSSEPALGWLPEELLGVPLRDLIHPEDGPCAEQAGNRSDSPDRDRNEIRIRTGDGQWRWMSDAWHLLRDENGAIEGGVHSLRDIDKEHEAREALSFLAYHDQLTRLASRTVAEERLDRLLSHDRRGGATIAVLFIDLDGLKAINDEFGHAAGDAAIRTTAARLVASARSEDLVARFGGDEFVVLLPSIVGVADALVVAERIRQDAAGPVTFEGHELRFSVSIGVALASLGADSSDTLRRADAALYEAKRSGRDRTVLAP